jgi:hypothetical protein
MCTIDIVAPFATFVKHFRRIQRGGGPRRQPTSQHARGDRQRLGQAELL